jgi:hypothetical protein
VAEAPGWFARLMHWLGAMIGRLFSWTNGIEDAGWPLRGLLVVLAVVLLVRAVFQMAESARRARAVADEGPVIARTLRDEQWSWRRADELAARGAYAAAMLSAFHGAMQGLDRRGLLRYRPSATPRELLRRATLSEATRSALEPLLATLYRAVFAAEPVGLEAFQEWVRRLRGSVDAPAR